MVRLGEVTARNPAKDRRRGRRLVAGAQRSQRLLVVRPREIALADPFSGAGSLDVPGDNGGRAMVNGRTMRPARVGAGHVSESGGAASLETTIPQSSSLTSEAEARP